MTIQSDTILSMTQANQNFSSVARTVDHTGRAVIFKNNKPKYVVLDADSNAFLLNLTDEDIMDIAARRVLARYLPAFRELAK